MAMAALLTQFPSTATLPSCTNPLERHRNSIRAREVVNPELSHRRTLSPALITLSSSEASDASSSRTGQAPPQKGRQNAEKPKGKGVSKRQLLKWGGAAGLAAVACPLCGVDEAKADVWGYGALSGPAGWGGLCAAGLRQSPVDVSLEDATRNAKSDAALQFKYGPCAPSFLNTGHGTMQVDFPPNMCSMDIGGRKLDLLQYHFHSPSEHAFEGVHAAMEAHLVHRDIDGRLAVVGVMLSGRSAEPNNPCLQAALDFAPRQRYQRKTGALRCLDADPDPTKPKPCPPVQVDPMGLLPAAKGQPLSYVHYSGSLTTPPCSEGVDWYLLTEPVGVPAQQVLSFLRYVGDRNSLASNARPLQEMGGRMMFLES